jgi:fibronectin-binding autotransporter adhesin
MHIYRCLAAALVCLGAIFPGARAADNTWTNSSGDSLWNVTSANWTTPSVWNNLAGSPDAAIFGGSGVGTITLSTGINVRSLNFGTTDGYTLTGGDLRLVNAGTGTLGSSTINVGGTTSALTFQNATIDSNLFSRTGLIKTGDGTLTLGGAANSIQGFRTLSGSGLGVNVLIGNDTSTTFGGSLRLSTASALGNATVGIGNGVFDIGSLNAAVGGLTFANTKSNTAYTANLQGVIGTGTLNVTGPIRSVGNGTGWANYINVPVDANSGVLRIEAGSGGNVNREIMFLQPISNGSVFKTYGVDTAGIVSLGGFSMLANNTYSGPTVINGGTNVIAGTNNSTSLSFANSISTIQAGGSFSAVTEVRLISNSSLTLSDSATLSGNNTPAVAAAVLNDRLGTTAAVLLDGGTLAVVGAAGFDASHTIASVNAPQGFNRINLTQGTGNAAIVTVSGDLTLGTGSTLVVSGSTIGTTATITPATTRFVVNGNTPTAVNGLIPGLYTATSVGGAPTTFARNSSTAGVGIVGLVAADYTPNSFGSGATANVDLTTAQTLSASQSANAIRTSVGITIGSGNTLTLGAGGLLTTSGITVAGPGTLAFGSTPGLITANTGTTTFSGPITGTAGLYRSGAGTVTFSGDLSGLSGGLFLSGIVTTNLNTATYSGPITIRGGTLATNANIGTGGLVTIGTPNTTAGAVGTPATLNINTVNTPTFARNIAVVGGSGTSAFAGASGMILTAFSGGNQTISGTVDLGTHLTVNGTTTSGTATTFNGVISGVGGLNILAGNVTLANASNTFAGGLQLNSGNTIGTSDGALGTGTVRQLGGTLQTNFAGNFSRGITVLTSSAINTNGNNITVTGGLNGENQNSTYTKNGAGTLTLAGNSSFPGTLAIASASAGSLTVGGANGALPLVAGVTVPTGTTFTVDNSAGYLADRFNDLGNINLSGGLARYLPSATGSSTQTETFGILSSSTLGSVFSVASSAATGVQVRFSALNLSSALTIRGDGLGDSTLGANTTRILIDSFTSNVGVIPNLFFANTSGTTTSTLAAGYDVTRGIIQFSPPPASGTSINNFTPDNVSTIAAFTTTGNATAATGAQIYSLILDGGSTLTLNGGNAASTTNGNTADGTLSLAGGVLTSQNGAKTIEVGTATTPVIAFGASVASITTTSDLTINSGINLTGSSGLVKSGAGTLTINGTYSITGPMTLNAGTTNLSGTTITAGAITLNAGTLNLAGTTGITTGAVSLSSATSLSLANSATIGSLSGAGTLDIAAGATVTINQTTNGTFTGNITGTPTSVVTKSGTSTLTFTPSGTPTYSGGTVIAGGTLALGNSAAATAVLANFSMGSAANTSGVLDLGGYSPTGSTTSISTIGTGTAHGMTNSNTTTSSTINLNLSVDTTLPMQFGGNLIVNKNDSTTLTLTGNAGLAATTTGVFNVNAGTLQLTGGGNTGIGSGMSINVAAGATLNQTLATGAGTGPFGTITLGTGATWSNTGSAYSDPSLFQLVMTGGSVSYSSSDALGTWMTFNGTGAGIITNPSSTASTINSTQPADRLNTALVIQTAKGTVASNGADLQLGIRFVGAVTKSGTGTLELNGPTGTNAPTGAITINAGAVRVTSVSGSGAITVNPTGTLEGTGTLGAATTVNAGTTALTGGRIRGGNTGSTTGTLTSSASVTINGSNTANAGGILQVAGNPTENTTLALTGSSTVLNFVSSGSGNTFGIELDAPDLVFGTPYSYTVASVATAGNIRLNGVNQTANTTIPADQYFLISPTWSAFTDVTLTVDGTGTFLILNFTPVPEPATVLAFSVVALGAFGIARRRMSRQAV